MRPAAESGVAYMVWTDGRDDLQLDIHYSWSSDFPGLRGRFKA